MVVFRDLSALFAAFTTLLPITHYHTPRLPPGKERCEQFAREITPVLKISDATVTNVEWRPKNSTLVVPNPEELCEMPSYQTEAAMCRVEVTVRTSATSSMLLEAWLPDEWYGRYLGTGNGGHAGCLRWTDLNHGAYHHFATVSTNNGHRGDTAKPFLHNDETLKDFVYRSIQVESRIGQQIVAAYYGRRNLGRRYYTGCSTGGRQGFKAIQSFPGLYDGLILGAPAIDWNSLMGSGALLGVHLGLNGARPGLLQPADLALLNADVTRQCDYLDGVRDGIIDDPDRCAYDPAALRCLGQSRTRCFSQEQVDAVRKILTPVYGPRGRLVYPRWDPHFAQASPQYLFGPDFYVYAAEWWRYAIMRDPAYNLTRFSVADIARANRLDPFGISTVDPDIGRFVRGGGKVLTFHGTADELIPQGATIQYYNAVKKQLGLDQRAMDGFWSHFQVPGMWHCSRGPAAWQFAQSGTAIRGLENSTETNVLLKMVEWVEGGVEPRTLTGTKFVEDEPDNGVERQRRYCKYPLKSTWDRSGDVNEAGSWKCV